MDKDMPEWARAARLPTGGHSQGHSGRRSALAGPGLIPKWTLSKGFGAKWFIWRGDPRKQGWGMGER